ncbi:MAG: chalcone isomerase family protein [Acidobacteriota bacterium]
MMRRVLVSFTVLALCVPVWAGELAGVKAPDTITVGEEKLVLNGLGLRKKAVFKVYVGALYLPAKSSDPGAVIALEAPKRMEMHFLRDVDAESIASAWRDGFANNSSAKLASLQTRLDEFAGKWQDMKTGEVAAMTYHGGGVLKLELKGKEVGAFRGKEFADAVFACWLGDSPPSADLKNGVLGR